MLMTLLVSGLITTEPLCRHALCRGGHKLPSRNELYRDAVPCDTPIDIPAPVQEVDIVGYTQEGPGFPVAPIARRHRYHSGFI